ncbi:hypothetical protein B9K06_13775 [Bacillus sp. OG2]|nr:hypothetical protein B9K06_13775 [Bacillus sp. OG2]
MSKTNMRKFIAGSVTAAVVASAMAPAASADVKTFSDVKDSHWAATEIYSLVEQGIINGYPDGTFRPSVTLNRGQAANLLTSALELDIPSDLSAFKDLSSKSVFAEGAAATKAAGIFGGKENGTVFGAADELTREQMASVLVRAFDLEDTGEEVSFTDWARISPSHRENVKILAQNGITTGKADGSFDPKSAVSRAHFVTFLYRAMNMEEVKEIESLATLTDITVKEGEKVELPKVVEATYADDSKEDVAVVWEEADFSKPGVYNVEGTVEGTDLKAKVKVTVEEVAPAVESVSAVTLTQLQVKFNKSVNKDTLSTDDITVVGAQVSDVELQEDGKTVLVTVSAALSNDTNYRVTVNGIETADGKSFPKFDQVINVSDSTAPTATGVEYVKALDTATVSFSEALQSIGTVTITDKNGVTTSVSTTDFTAGDKSLEISTAGLADGPYTVTFVGATDLAGNYFAGNKLTVNFTVGSTDTVKPEVSNVKVVGKNLIEVTFSEKLAVQGTVKANSAEAVNLTADSKLDNAGDYKVDASGTVYTINVGSLNNDAFNTFVFVGQKDLAGNTIDTVTKTVSYLDVTAPKLVDTKVNGTTVTLSFDEAVVVADAGTAQFVAPNGVLKTVAADKISVSGTNNKEVVVDLAGYVDQVQSGNYSLRFAKDAVSDLNDNSAAVTTSFTLSAAADTTKPTVVDANGDTVGNIAYNAADGTVTVQYSEAMGSSAKEVSNYTVDGQNVFESAYFDGNTSKVVLTLKDGVFSSTANRQFKISNVSDLAGNALTNSTYTETIQFSENTKPSLLGAVVATDGTKVTLTFSEAVTNIVEADDANVADFQVLVDGVVKTGTVESEVAGSNGTKFEITFANALTPSELAKSITLKAADTIDVEDLAGNELTEFGTVTVSK